MARTKQTARKSTGGPAPRRQLASGLSARSTAEIVVVPLTKEEKVQQELIKKGPMQSEIKYLERRYDGKGNVFTAEQREIKVPKQKEDWWEKFALCITRQLDYQNKTVQSTSLQINSQALKDLVKDVIGNFPGQSFMTKNISILFPPRSLYHYRQELRAAGEQYDEDTIEGGHVDLLNGFIDEHFKDTIADTTNLLEEGLITYEYLWTIFRPGVTVFSQSLGQPRAYTLLSYQYVGGMRPCLQLNVSFIDWDGENFGTRETTLMISPFAGAEKVVDLPVYPLEGYVSAAKKASLIKRGRKFESLAGQNLRYYKGIAVELGCRISRHNIEGRVMIDAKTFHRLNADCAFEVSALNNSADVAPAPARSAKRRKGQANEDDWELLPSGEANVLQTLTEDQCLLANATVRGFSFNEKIFVDFFVSLLEEIEWNENCFDELVLPTEQKSLVQALVTEHTREGKDAFDDIVKGKGKGLIMVLHGPPGVGKTLTAECVAEYSKRPLYMVSSGDLGTNSEALDARLTRILDIASTWRCVVLIDEADVFMEERSSSDVERNCLVSIFLRVLEYYKGLLFLTTNRITTFDDAFKSRIHVPLKYSNLPFDSRKAIWKNLLRKVEGGVAIDEKGYNQLAARALNGRQVKNVVRTSQSLARFNGRKLDLQQLEAVSVIQEQFEQDLENLQALPTPP